MASTDKKAREIRDTGRKGHRAFSFIKAAGALAAVIAAICAFLIISGQMIIVRKYSIPTETGGKVTIAALTDLHGSMLGNDQVRIVNRVRKADPDIIVYLGDMIERSRAEISAKNLVILTQQLAGIAPIYYVDGNHEEDVRNSEPETYEKLNAAMADAGAVQLDNETLQIEIGKDCTVNLCGITTHYYWDVKENEVAADLRERDGINIMICHFPETVIWRGAFDGGGLDLALCGHTHGGLVRVPFKGGMYAPEWGWWPMYDLGEYPVYSDTDWRHYGGGDGAEYWGTMIVSGGLAGEHGVPRLNNPMEISIVEIGN